MNIPSRTIVKVLSIITLFVVGLDIAYICRREIIWVITAYALALALNPATTWLAKRLPGRSRGLAAGLVFTGVLAFIALLAVLFVPPLVSQTEHLSQNLPRYTDQLLSNNSWSGKLITKYQLVDKVRTSQTELIAHLSNAGGSFLGIVESLFNSLIAGITIFFLTFFMLMEGPKWTKIFFDLHPDTRREHNRELAGRMYKVVTSYVNGKLLMSLLAAIPTALLLVILGVPYAISLGILIGVFDLIPLVGATLGAVIVVIVCIFSSSLAAIVMAIYFLIYQQVENHIFQPIIFGRSVQVSALVVLMSIVFGTAIGGMLGALLAIPVAASLQIVVKDYLMAHHLRHDAQLK
jgi:predicted PurR-regulated permease PerM